MYNNVIIKTGNSIEIGNVLTELSNLNDMNDNNLKDQSQLLMYSLLSAMTYFRDIKKENINSDFLKELLNPYNFEKLLNATNEDKFYLPEDYLEEGHHRTAKDMLIEISYKLNFENKEQFVINFHHLTEKYLEKLKELNF